MDNNVSVVEVAGAEVVEFAVADKVAPIQEVVVNDLPINPVVADLSPAVIDTVQETPIVVQRAAKASKKGNKATKKTEPVEPEVKKPAAKKTEKTVVVEEKKPQRGRPIVYFGARKKHIVTLLKHHGITGTMAILNADVNSKDAAVVELANKRSLHLVPEGLGITAPTLGKFAKEAGIVLHRGRPKLKVAKLKKAA